MLIIFYMLCIAFAIAGMWWIAAGILLGFLRIKEVHQKDREAALWRYNLSQLSEEEYQAYLARIKIEYGYNN